MDPTLLAYRFDDVEINRAATAPRASRGRPNSSLRCFDFKAPRRTQSSLFFIRANDVFELIGGPLARLNLNPFVFSTGLVPCSTSCAQGEANFFVSTPPQRARWKGGVCNNVQDNYSRSSTGLRDVRFTSLFLSVESVRAGGIDAYSL